MGTLLMLSQKRMVSVDEPLPREWHFKTIMHSSRTRTARSSSFVWGMLDLIPLNVPLGYGPGSDPLNFPLGCGPGPDPPNFPLGCGPGSDLPQFPPWLWAWI